MEHASLVLAAPILVPETQSAFHPHAQRSVDRREASAESHWKKLVNGSALAWSIGEKK
jgi:hypothetical protein